MFKKDIARPAFFAATLVFCAAFSSQAQVVRSSPAQVTRSSQSQVERNRRAGGAFAPGRYALILADPPVGTRYGARESLQTAEAVGYRQTVERAQAQVRTELASRNIAVTGSVTTLLNAIFVVAPPDSLDALRAIPGVAGVVPMRRGQRFLNQATSLMNGPAAWALSAIGGQTNAGKGIKIGILDTGIDQTHPAFQDPTLTPPSGFPRCNSDPTWSCSAFTNNKVIVARSYVRQIAAGGETQAVNPATSQPDDYSPMDRVGHGTAVASTAAANPTTGGTVPIVGMAPKAFLGSYKIYGSDGVNDYPPEDVWIQAIEDAFNDGMDVVNLSSGMSPTSGPLDTGAACGNPSGVPCDPLATAFENAAEAGMVVVVSAGNGGLNGSVCYYCSPYPMYGSIASPGYAPSVITAGATLNSHAFGPSVSVAGPGAPSNLQNIASVPSDSVGYALGGQTAPLVDVSFIGDGYACSALPAGSLNNSFALVQRGPTGSAACSFATKATNVQNAGAIGLILYQAPDSPAWNTNNPSYNFVEQVYTFVGSVVGIGNSDGVNLKNYVDNTAIASYFANTSVDPWPQVTIDLSGAERPPDASANLLASYSSEGPTLGYFPLCGTCASPPLKPDVVATGGGDPELYPDPNDGDIYGFSGLYVATQSVDPSGEIYSTTRYAAANGTSFAAPLTAGAAALVKQANQGNTSLTAAQMGALIKSAIVNYSNASAVPTDDGIVGFLAGYGFPIYLPLDVRQTGAGLLNASTAVQATVTASPPTIAFTPVKAGGSLPPSQTITFTNRGASAVTLTPSVTWVAGEQPTSSTTLTTNPATSLSLGTAGSGTASAALTVSLSGSVPAAGAYSGNINLSGAGVSMHLPFLFLVGSSALGSGTTITGNVIPLFGTSFDYLAGQDLGPIAMQTLDASGVPVSGVPVTFCSVSPTTGLCAAGGVTMKSLAGEPACSPASSTVSVTCNTDNYGIAYTDVVLGTTPETAIMEAWVSGLQSQTYVDFYVNIREAPAAAAALDAAIGKTTIAPGSYVSIYGSGLCDYPSDVATTSPLPLSLDGVTVSFDAPGISVPGRLVYVSPTQVNVQVPWELQGQSSVQMKVTLYEYEYGNLVTVPVASVSPAFFEISTGNVAALIAGTYTFVTSSTPVPRGAGVQLYANGLGPVNNQPASGVSAPATKSASTTGTCVVTIGGQPAPVTYCGLAPGTPGVYEIDATAPTNIAAGAQTVALTIGGQAAPLTSIAVK